MAGEVLTEMLCIGLRQLPEHIWGASLLCFGLFCFSQSRELSLRAQLIEDQPVLSVQEAVRKLREQGGKPMFVVVRGELLSEGSTAVPCGGGEQSAAVCWSELVSVPLNSWWSELLWSSSPTTHASRMGVPFQVGGVHTDINGLEVTPRCVRADISTSVQGGVLRAVQGIESALVNGTQVTLVGELAVVSRPIVPGMMNAMQRTVGVATRVIFRQPRGTHAHYAYQMTEAMPHDLVYSLRAWARDWRHIGFGLAAAGAVL
eukprot:CAMPEP_0206220682 /NCGR_PEP_ID=MMETSP0047_2-20121206/5010_1 /ASSEMBLY_ACC=CAM_ASM_000192 /TAXON_ID=195065 /ORGANISM="Chroomonas mesostigmatica_cf, Strain CCMP1168" /LENGTH=259 /DNA_ID=CAMNT_0053643363 /DNA_START=26 /DNA_END=802 /DNA_ORIENTATION=+